MKHLVILLLATIVTLTSTAGDYKMAVAGCNHFMVVKNDGTLWGWGSNTVDKLEMG